MIHIFWCFKNLYLFALNGFLIFVSQIFYFGKFRTWLTEKKLLTKYFFKVIFKVFFVKIAWRQILF